MLYKENKFIFIVFSIILLGFEDFNNGTKFIIINIVLRLN